MRQAMANAEVGDDVLDGDPTVRGLEESAARWLGKDGALYVPSGTMANQVALGAWGRPGEEVLLDEVSHIVMYEAGAMACLHGLQASFLRSVDGALDPDEVRGAVRPDFVHCPRTRLLCVEQTHMLSGGRVVPLERLRELHDVAKESGLAVHMDGARLANAVVASGIPARDWAATTDSVSVCLSKGLGAPVGSIIAGGEDFLERARVVRKRLGGWMRQSGIIAAAGRIALEEGVERLAEDHALARQLALALDGMEGLSARVDEVETNIVAIGVEHEDWDADSLAERLGEEGVGVYPLRPGFLRFVTHRDVGPEDLERLIEALGRIL